MPPRVLKRPAQSSQPSQPSAAPSSSVPPRPTPSSRPAKRQKLSPSPSPSPEPEASTSTLPPPPKRAFHEGKLRRLAVPLPGKAKAGTGSTLSGAKIGGKSKDLNVVGEIREEMFVTRKGIGFGGYFKKGVASFLENGCSSLTIHAMGAAIPLALSLSMAIRDALPGGTPQEGKEASVKLEIKTGTVDVPDEITPDDEDEDIVYQTRSKSTVEIVLSLNVVIGKPRLERSANSRGRGGRGRGRGTGRGRGRGMP